MKPTNEVIFNMVENLTKNLETFIGDTKEYHKAHDEKQEKILTNVIKTNGRVNKLEETTENHAIEINDYKKRKANIEGVFKLWSIIGALVLTGVGYSWWLYMQNFKNEIINELAPKVSDMVYQKLEKEYEIDVK